MEKKSKLPILIRIPAFLFIVFAAFNFYQRAEFQNPIGFTIVGNSLFVLEKKGNTILEFDLDSRKNRLILKNSASIEPDEENRYFMVRKLYKGPDGFVVKSYIYDKNSREFRGYRFREYISLDEKPNDILTVILPNPMEYPEINYAAGKDKFHYFSNNCVGCKNIWKVPNSGNALIEGLEVHNFITELGDKNNEFSYFEGICVGPDGSIYLSSGEKGKVLKYSSDGSLIAEIGEPGFGEGKMLAPANIFFASFDLSADEEFLTVACCGSRAWLQFDNSGNPVKTLNLLKLGYPFSDILVGEIYTGTSKQRIYTFDLANKNFIRLSAFLQFEKAKKSFSPFSRLSYLMRGERETDFGRVYFKKWGIKFIVPLFIGVGLFALSFFWTPVVSVLKKIRVPFFAKLLLLFIPMLVISGYFIAACVGGIMMKNIEEEYVRRSANLARAIINNISYADLEKIRNPEDRRSPEYEKIYQTVSSILDSVHVEQTPKWIIHLIVGGRYYFGVNIWKGSIYEPFIIPEEREMFFSVLKEKTPKWGRFSDDQGEWFSYLHPICSPDGKVTNVLELYRPTEAIKRAEKNVASQVKKLVFFTVIAAALVVLCFSYLFTRPLRKLIYGTEIISAGNFLHHIDINSRDELADLGEAFNKMVADIRKYTEDLKKTTSEREKINSELRLAREIQLGMLPSTFPPYEKAPNINIYARMLPAKTIGGDYYDFFPVDKEHFGVVIADASGKGIPAALFIMLVRTLIRNLSPGILSPSETIARLNNLLSEDNPSNSFATILYIIFNMNTGVAKYCNAGHLCPIKLSNGKASFVTDPGRKNGGMVVGVMPESQYGEGEFIIEKGESIVLYTDGITEATDEKNRMFGEEKLLEILSDYSILPFDKLSETIIKAVHNYQRGVEQVDDITLLFMKRL